MTEQEKELLKAEIIRMFKDNKYVSVGELMHDIVYYIDSLPSQDVPSDTLHAAKDKELQEARELIKGFVNRVEDGSIRSVKTYALFTDFLTRTALKQERGEG